MHRLRVGHLFLLMPYGLILLYIGISGDSKGWWDNLSYGSNVLAGLTAACFGVPIAAKVIQWLVRKDADARRGRELLNSARRNLADIQASLESQEIDKVHRLVEPLATAELYISGLDFAVRYSGSIRVRLAEQGAPPLSAVIPVISENLPSNAAEGWRFAAAVRRWEVLNMSVLSSAEVDGIRIVSDEEFSFISASVDAVTGAPLESLPTLLHDLDSLIELLNEVRAGRGGVPMAHAALPFIGELNATVSKVRRQINARADMHKGVCAARNSVDSMKL